MRDYSNLNPKTREFLQQADTLFDMGKYDEASFAYINADGSTTDDDLYVSIDVMLGQIKCDVYKRVQNQSFSSEQGMNDVGFIRGEFRIQRNQIQEYRKIYEEHFGPDQSFFDANAALEELNKLREYYERSYRLYLERQKSSRSFWGRLFS